MCASFDCKNEPFRQAKLLNSVSMQDISVRSTVSSFLMLAQCLAKLIDILSICVLGLKDKTNGK